MQASDFFEPDPVGLAGLPTIDDTIAAMTLLGRILDELKERLRVAERTVASLQKEKVALRAELRAIVDCVASRPVVRATVETAPEPKETAFEDALLALIQGADRSFGRAAAKH